MDELKKLREQLRAKVEEARKLNEKGKVEKRALTPEEQTAWAALVKEIGDLQARVTALEEKQPAEPMPAEAEAERSKWLTDLDAELAKPRDRHTRTRLNDGTSNTRTVTRDGRDSRAARIQIPARAYRAARLKAFRGEYAEQKAYLSGQFIRAVVFGSTEAREWCRDNGIELRAAQAEGINALGGYLVPEEFAQTIIDLREEYGSFRANARIWPMASDTAFIPRRLTGLTATFVGENQEIPESNKTWDGVQLTARKLGVLAKYSSELDEDAIISIADDLASEIAYAFAYKEDLCGWLGDGTSTYGGITGVVTKINDGNHAGSIVTATAGNLAYGTLDLIDFIMATGQLPTYALPGAKWYMSNPAFANSAARLAYAQGGNDAAVIAGKLQRTFLGYPVEMVHVLNSTLTDQASTIVSLFGDLTLAATMGVRRPITIKKSEERYFELDQLAIRGTERFDINVHDVGNATTAGPLVALKTPAS